MSVTRLNAAERLRGEARVVGVARTAERHHLGFTVFSRQNDCAAADMVRDETGRSIWGVVYEIPVDLVYREQQRDGWRCLDVIEGEGKRYRRMAIELLDGSGRPLAGAVETYCVRPEKRVPGLSTNEIYASHIVRGLVEHRAPADYLDYVIERIQDSNPALEESLLRQLA
jgi:hypothetical protein